MHLDPTSLHLFVRVLETGTIAAVAEQEFIAASAISKRISDENFRPGTLEKWNLGWEQLSAGLRRHCRIHWRHALPGGLPGSPAGTCRCEHR